MIGPTAGPRGVLAVAALAALALGLAALAAPAPASAGAIAVSDLRATTEDPTGIEFTARVTAPAGLASATLVYRVLNPKGGDVGGHGEASFGPGEENDVRFALETRSARRYIPVGSVLRYRWEFTDAEGDSHASEEREYLFLDGRYRWSERSRGGVTVYWYGGNEAFAERALDAAASAIAETEALLRVETPYPVRVLVWASEDDGSLAMRPRSEAFDELVSTGGQRTAPDLLFVFAASADVVRHEAAHIVTAVAGDGPFSRIPSWLDEGTAVYLQRSPRPYDDALRFSVRADRTMRLRNMESPANNPGQVDVFYGQSWSTVRYLIEQHGEAAFADLFRAVREGARTDDALEAVYGFDQDGLYNRWREAQGLDPIDFAPRAESTAPPAAEATRAPLTIPSGGGSSAAEDAAAAEDGDASGETAAPPAATAVAGGGEAASAAGGSGGRTGTAIAVGAGALAIGGALGFAALFVARRSRAA